VYVTSVFHGQIYPSLLPGRQFPNLAGVYPLPASWEHWGKILEMLGEDKRAPVSDKQTV
jgi:hypothetical protein